ncbi:hypothetical protein [Dactylosporangium sp. CA-092794]|uniref:restriction system modified-DNA reader domain-containing protein n=1 Tax=Dactylosporangium sp. CA-092794 TaxID=3239929 RepID=UPI003D925A29
MDEEVFAFLQRHGEPLVDTPNDVLRRLLLGSGPAPAAGSARARRPGALHQLITAGQIAADDALRFEQPRMRQIHEAVVTADGWIRLPDGREFAAPSPALMAQTGITINGWAYLHVRSGRTLASLRTEFMDNADLRDRSR